MRGAALLVCDDPVFALGPILVADEIEEAMEGMTAFIAALGEDPSEMPTIRLMIEWQGFLAAITPGPLGILPETQEAPGEPDTVPHGETGTEAQSAPQSVAGEAPGGFTDDDGRADEVVSVAQDAPGDPTARSSQHSETEAGQLAEPGLSDGGATVPPDDEDEADDEDDELDLADRLANVPGGTPRQRGLVECFACQGTGVAPGPDGQKCNLCGGEGKILEPEPVAATTTDEEQAQ